MVELVKLKHVKIDNLPSTLQDNVNILLENDHCFDSCSLSPKFKDNLKKVGLLVENRHLFYATVAEQSRYTSLLIAALPQLFNTTSPTINTSRIRLHKRLKKLIIIDSQKQLYNKLHMINIILKIVTNQTEANPTLGSQQAENLTLTLCRLISYSIYNREDLVLKLLIELLSCNWITPNTVMNLFLNLCAYTSPIQIGNIQMLEALNGHLNLTQDELISILSTNITGLEFKQKPLLL